MRRRFAVVFATALLMAAGLSFVAAPAAQATTDTCSYWEAKGWPSFTVGSNPKARYNNHPASDDTTTPYWAGSATTLCIDAAGEHLEATWQYQFGGPAYGLIGSTDNHYVQGAYVGAAGPVQAGTGAYIDTWPSITTTGDGTYTITFNVKYCVGPQGVTPCPATTTATQTVQRTGVIANTVTLTPPPAGTNTGYTATTGPTTVCLHGICQTAPVSGQSAGAGISTSQFYSMYTIQWNMAYPVCTGVGQCTTVAMPTGVKVSYNGLPLAVATVAGSTVPVTIPGGTRCISIGVSC